MSLTRKMLVLLALSWTLAGLALAFDLTLASNAVACFDCRSYEYIYSSGMERGLLAELSWFPVDPLNPWDLAVLAFVGVIVTRWLSPKRAEPEDEDVSRQP